MKIHELFLKPVDRPIDGVIKADDARNLQTELEEYVVTRDVAKGLGIFTDRYLNELTANGVWISASSARVNRTCSRFSRLSLMAAPSQRRIAPPKSSCRRLRTKLCAETRKAIAIPSRSILFNIDQKFDGIGGDHSAPILEVSSRC